jgi:ribosome biogenesis protein BMS1
MDDERPNKQHHAPHKSDKKSADVHNIKAFGYMKGDRARQAVAHQLNIEQIRLFQPDTRPLTREDPPIVVAVQGPPGCGKSLVIRCLIKRYTGQVIHVVKGPVTVVANRSQRITFLEVPSDLNAMMDAAKIADVALLLVNAEHNFEMETFEFLNLLLSHGFPKVIAVITHLDQVERHVARTIKARFHKELNTQLKVYKLGRLVHGKYEKESIISLGRLLSLNTIRLLSFRQKRGYVLADRAEESPDHTTLLFGYVRGDGLSTGQKVHLCGAGDFPIQSIRGLDDPCPLFPKETSQRTLKDQGQRLYAPMSEVKGLKIDDDTIYVDVPRHETHFTKPSALDLSPEDAASLEKEITVTKGVQLVRDMQEVGQAPEKEIPQVRVFSGVYVSPKSPTADCAPEEEEVEEDESEKKEEDPDEPDEQPEPVPAAEFGPGKYVRIEFACIPHSFFEIFDPTRPIVLGGLLEPELGEPGLQWVKIKRHRFYERKPKSSDPMVVTIGWRRFQVLPVFFTEERGDRNRFLKYMPDFLTCWAVFHGPPSAANVGVTAFQHIRENLEMFRITATGVTVEPMGDGNIVKKLRVTGSPSDIFHKTAKISNMFTSDIEATQFIGALIRTVSGIRGVIKAVEKLGAVRCAFEDKVKSSDIVFLNTWVKVVPTELFTPVNSLLSNQWNLVRTTAELRAKLNLRPQYKEDSVYRPVKRPEYAPQVLRVPTALNQKLPYAVKKLFEPKQTKRAQILNEQEAGVLGMIKDIATLYEKQKKDKEAEDAAAEAARKKAAAKEEAIHKHKRCRRKQEFFARRSASLHKKR